MAPVRPGRTAAVRGKPVLAKPKRAGRLGGGWLRAGLPAEPSLRFGAFVTFQIHRREESEGPSSFWLRLHEPTPRFPGGLGALRPDPPPTCHWSEPLAQWPAGAFGGACTELAPEATPGLRRGAQTQGVWGGGGHAVLSLRPACHLPGTLIRRNPVCPQQTASFRGDRGAFTQGEPRQLGPPQPGAPSTGVPKPPTDLAQGSNLKLQKRLLLNQLRPFYIVN